MAEGRHVFLKIVHSLSISPLLDANGGQTKQSERKPKAPGSGVKGQASKQRIRSPTP